MSVSVQVVVKNSEMVDYEKKTEMHVQVRCAEMLKDTDAMGSWAPVLPSALLSSGCGH